MSPPPTPASPRRAPRGLARLLGCFFYLGVLGLVPWAGLATAGCQKPAATEARPKARDLVCGMDVEVGGEGVLRVEHEGKPYHFCSRECADAFKKNPLPFLKKAPSARAGSHAQEKTP
jgi:Cu+-exporting ATPase